MEEPLSLPEMLDRSRVASSSVTSFPVAFMRSTEASLFVTNSIETRPSGFIDTRGTNIESELMDLLSDILPVSFIDISDEEMTPFPEANFANARRNAHGLPTQKVCPIPRQQEVTRDSKPPAVPSQASALTAYIAPQQRAVDSNVRPIQQAHYLPMFVPFYPNGWNNQVFGSFSHNAQPLPTNNVSNNIGPILQMSPPVMLEVAGYCSSCMKNYDHIAVETLTGFVAWSEYPEEIIRDRNLRCGWI